MAGRGYGEAMTILVLLAGLAATIAAVAGYVTWRGRRGVRGSYLHPAVSRQALNEADRQGVQGRVAAIDGIPISLPHNGPGRGPRW